MKKLNHTFCAAQQSNWKIVHVLQRETEAIPLIHI